MRMNIYVSSCISPLGIDWFDHYPFSLIIPIYEVVCDIKAFSRVAYSYFLLFCLWEKGELTYRPCLNTMVASLSFGFSICQLRAEVLQIGHEAFVSGLWSHSEYGFVVFAHIAIY